MSAITGLAVIYGSDTVPPKHYTKIPKDLNSGTVGDQVYLCYTKNLFIGPPITAIQVASNSRDDPDLIPTGYTKVEGDLNKGTAGPYIFLSYQANGVRPPIIDLDVVIGSEKLIWPTEDYYRVDQDCSEGAHGNYVYIVFKPATTCIPADVINPPEAEAATVENN